MADLIKKSIFGFHIKEEFANRLSDCKLVKEECLVRHYFPRVIVYFLG